MRSVFGLLTVVIVMGLAYWAYQENIKTQATIARTEQLQADIGAARSRLSVLRAEWAFLNRPDRLINLSNQYFTQLQLAPLRAENFGEIGQVDFPSDFKFDLRSIDAIEVAERGAQ